MPWYTLPIGLSNLLAKRSSVDGDLVIWLSVLAAMVDPGRSIIVQGVFKIDQNLLRTP